MREAFKRSAECSRGPYRRSRRHTASFGVSARRIADNPLPYLEHTIEIRTPKVRMTMVFFYKSLFYAAFGGRIFYFSIGLQNSPIKNMLIFHPPVFCSLSIKNHIKLRVFLEPNYTYKHKNICYNNIAHRFDNFKILMYN